jgi:hypothetical protein
MTKYPMSEAQRITPTLLTEAAKPPVKRTAREIANERWFGGKEKAAPIAEGGHLEFEALSA